MTTIIQAAHASTYRSCIDHLRPWTPPFGTVLNPCYCDCEHNKLFLYWPDEEPVGMPYSIDSKGNEQPVGH